MQDQTSTNPPDRHYSRSKVCRCPILSSLGFFRMHTGNFNNAHDILCPENTIHNHTVPCTLILRITKFNSQAFVSWTLLSWVLSVQGTVWFQDQNRWIYIVIQYMMYHKKTVIMPSNSKARNGLFAATIYHLNHHNLYHSLYQVFTFTAFNV